MAIPSGSGTEVLKTHRVSAMSSTYVDLIPSPTANHIYTILSIIFHNTHASNDEVLYMRITDADGSSNPHFIIENQALNAYATFVWNDKIVVSGDIHLQGATGNSADVDVTVSYIDQDHT